MTAIRRPNNEDAADFLVMLEAGSFKELSDRLERRVGAKSVSAKAWYDTGAPWVHDSKIAVIYENLATARVNVPRDVLEKEFGAENVSANFELQVPEISTPSTPLSGSRDCKFDQSAESWSRQIIDPPPKSGLDGSGIKVCLVDTGITAGHPDFIGRPQDLGHMRSFVPPNPHDIEDFKGHGTHCAGIICGKSTPGKLPRYGIAPAIELFVANVFGRATITNVDKLIAALEWAIDRQCEIVSMSLYTPLRQHRNPQAVSDAAKFEQTVQRALARGTILIACTGNSSNRRKGKVETARFPASLPSVFAVGGIDTCRKILNKSNSGASVVGPGESVWSAFHDYNKYTFMTGTSMATANVAGVAALHAQSNSSLRGVALINQLKATAHDLGLPAPDMGQGLAQVP
jgi:subtilisin